MTSQDVALYQHQTSVGDTATATAAPVARPGLVALQPLTPKQEAFAQAFVATRNKSMAYRQAYDVATTNRQTIYSNAADLCNLPQVAVRITELNNEAAGRCVLTKTAFIDMIAQRLLANRSDVMRTVRVCCRHCYGVGHKYQWVDELEYVTELAAVLDWNSAYPKARKPVPDDAGGYGFDPHAEPAATCTVRPCLGHGELRTIITDTDKLTGGAALIFEGVKETKDGIEVKMASWASDAALFMKATGLDSNDLEAMMRGAAAGAAGGAIAAQAVAEKVKDMTADDTRLAYLSLVS